MLHPQQRQNIFFAMDTPRFPITITQVLLMLMLLLSVEERAGAVTWTTVNSNPQINGSFMLNSTTGWTAGPAGSVRTTTDGTNWGAPVLATGNVNDALIGVWASDASHAWAVGGFGVIAFWNGSTWATQTSGTAQNLNAVWGKDATHVWAVGNAGTIRFWNGSAWSTQASGTTQTLNAVWGADASHVWAVGATGTILFWNGTAWSAQTSGTTNDFASVWASDANNAWAVGTTNVIQYWNGSVWSPVAPVPSATYSGSYASVRGIDASNVWLVGGSYVMYWNGTAWSVQTSSSGVAGIFIGFSAISKSALWVTSSAGDIRRWNGSVWVLQNAGLLNDLNGGVSGSAANNVMAPDIAGGVKTFNGTTWTSVASGTSFGFNGGFVLDSTHAWMVGNSGTIRFWNGSAWIGQTSGTSQTLYAVWAADASNVWAGGFNGTIVKWNGTAWAAQTTGTTAWFTSMWGLDATHVWAITSAGAVYFWNGTVWAVHSSSGAQNNCIWGTDATHIWTVGPSGAISYWNGTSWAFQTSGTSNQLMAVWGLSANDVYAVGVGGTILHWNGTAWSTQSSGTSQWLRGIWGQANGTVWVVGGGATIVGASLAATSPQAALQQPVGTTLVNVTSHVAYPAATAGTAAGTKTFTIQNNGTAALTVTSASVSGGNAADFTVSTTGMAASVAAGGSTTFTVTCTPSAFGSRSTTLSVVTGDILRSPISVTLDGTGLGPDIAVEQPVGTGIADGGGSNFGNVLLSGSASLTFTLRNPGTTSLTGLGITIDGTDAAQFSVTASPSAPVAAGGSTTFTVQLTPASVGTKAAALHIASNVFGTKNPYDITLTGVAYTGSPITGTKSVGPTGNYASISTALTDITLSTLGGPVVLELQPAYSSASETFPLVFANLGTTAVKTLTLRPQTGATGLAISSADTTAATVDLNGAQFVTIDGRPGGVGSNAGSGVGAALQPSVLTIANTNTTFGVALRFINEASGNTLRYTTLQSVNAATFSGTVVFSSTTGPNGNDNNTIDHCDIRDGASTPSTCLFSVGSTGTTAQNNSGNTVSNCNIFNFYSINGAASAGVRLDGGNTDWTITGNSFYQTASRAAVSLSSGRAIYLNNASGSNFTVTGNFIGGSAPNAGGTAWTTTGTGNVYQFVGIQLNAGITTPSSVQGNTIANIVWTSATTTSFLPGVWSGIYVQAGAANVGTVTGNSVGTGTGTGSVSITTSGTGGTSFGIGSASSNTVAIANNTIGSITVNGSDSTISASLIGIQVTAGANTISNNTVGSTTTANSFNAATASTSSTAQQVTGINVITSSTSASITSNTVANLNNNYAGTATAGQVRGIVTTNGVNTITGNTVRNLSTTSQNTGATTTASVLGIIDTSTTAGQTVSQNTVHSLANTAASAVVAVTGIYFAGPTSGTNILARNLTHSLAVSSSSVGSQLIGMYFNTGAFTAQNNMVRVGIKADASSTASVSLVFGIFDNGTTAGRNFYHNSVYLGGTHTSGSSPTLAFQSNGSGNARTFQNNLFVNARNNSGATSKHYSVFYSNVFGTSLTGLTAGGNILLASGTGGVLGNYNNADLTTLAAWQAATGQDATTAVADPLFIGPTGTAATVDLHLAANSPAINVGLPVGVTNDFDGQLRSTTTPTIGADEVPAPNIAVAQGAALTDGLSSVDFGTVTLGSSSSSAKTFTITNPGGADLTSLAITNDGTNAADFTVSAQSGTSIPVGPGTVTLTVTFTPTASGARSAALHIASNVIGAKNPFDIAITGTGQTVFEAWAATNGVAGDPNALGANGQRNVVNFAFGIHPVTGTGGALTFNGTLTTGGTIGAYGLPITWLEPIANGVDFRALFIVRKDAVAAGLTYTPQFSATLSTWANSTAVPTVLADDGSYQIVSVPYPPFVGGKKARFFRISVSLAP